MTGIKRTQLSKVPANLPQVNLVLGHACDQRPHYAMLLTFFGVQKAYRKTAQTWQAS